MKPMSPQQALHRLAAYCSRGERCIYDVRKKLTDWEIPENEQQEILKRLQEEDFLNEARFCRAFVNDKSKYNQWGVHKISFELRKRNIPDRFIRDALSAIQPEDNLDRLLRILRVKASTVKGKDDFEIRNKLMRFAAGRGFTVEEIGRALEKMKKM